MTVPHDRKIRSEMHQKLSVIVDRYNLLTISSATRLVVLSAVAVHFGAQIRYDRNTLQPSETRLFPPVLGNGIMAVDIELRRAKGRTRAMLNTELDQKDSAGRWSALRDRGTLQRRLRLFKHVTYACGRESQAWSMPAR